jgi:dynein heavy chain
LACAAISYNGPLTGSYRTELDELWKGQILEQNIPMSEKYAIVDVLGEPMVIREWIINGLPSDGVSVENSIFVTKGYRWPLIIDP